MSTGQPTDMREYHRQRRARMKAEGKCRCGQDPVEGYKKCQTCRESEQRHTRKRNSARREAGVCQNCGKESGGKAKCPTCRDVSIRYLQRLKSRVIAAYGGQCACCGESEPAFLTIDHVNEDGAKHRREIKTNRVYSWLEKHDYPQEGFQLLCFNCNCGRRINGGVCPHQQNP